MYGCIRPVRVEDRIVSKIASNKDPPSLSGMGIPRQDTFFPFVRGGCVSSKEGESRRLTDATAVRMQPRSETGRTGYLILRPRKLRVLASRQRIVRPHQFTRQVTTIEHPQDEKMESITTDPYEWPSMFEQIDYDDLSYTGS